MKYKKYQAERKVGKNAPVTKKEVKMLIEGKLEKKNLHNVISNASITSAGNTPIALADPAQGTTDDDRIGDEITVVRLFTQFRILSPSPNIIFSSADAYNHVRIIIFKWLMDDFASAPVTSDILDNSGTDLTNAYYNTTAQEKKYQICFDKTVRVYNTPVYDGTNVKYFAGIGSSERLRSDLFGKKLHSPRVHFRKGAITSVGQYYYMAVSDSGFAPHPTVEAEGVVVYTDA